MDIKKIKENLVKFSILVLNVVLAIGGVLYFKNKDQQKKEEKLSEEKAYNESVAKYEIDQIQSALKESNIQKEQSIVNNPGTVSKQETVTVKKTIPAVTQQVTVPKTSKSSKTTSSS